MDRLGFPLHVIVARAIVVFGVLLVCAQGAKAGKNANGALIVHTNDNYTYSAATACSAPEGEPASCGAAVTQSNKSSGAVVWLLAALPDTSNPAVSVVYFGIAYDDVNLDPGAGYRLCGPAGSIEVQDANWPYSGKGNSVAFGSPVIGDRLFPFYVFKIDGGTTGSYFGTAINPTGGYAEFVDDSNPPVEDRVTRFGTVRWFAPGSNECPGTGGGGGIDAPEGSDPGGDEPDPPSEITYKVKALDSLTGLPVSGVTIACTQIRADYFCYQVGCANCQYSEPEMPFTVTTGANGIGTRILDDWILCHVCGEPTVYCTSHHLRWSAPSVADNAYYVMQRWTAGDGGIQHIVYVTQTSVIAERFSPVIHGHKNRENENQVGNLLQTMDVSTLTGYYDAEPPIYFWQGPPQHRWDAGVEEPWCSHAERGIVNWFLDVDAAPHGAPVGSRPLYYHVFGNGAGTAVVQYWLWLNYNDLGTWDLCIPTCHSHEGDWEHLAVQLQAVGNDWEPTALTLYRHGCRRTVAPGDIWWSLGTLGTYHGLQQGSDYLHRHPHVWMAARSHGLYNRYEPVYRLNVAGVLAFYDRLDYNIAQQPRGPHRFLEYDFLRNMGEYYTTTIYHGVMDWDYHFLPVGTPVEESVYLQLEASFGNDIGSPFTPIGEKQTFGDWKVFENYPSGSCVQGSGDVEFGEPYVLEANYLGKFQTCETGSAETIHFDVDGTNYQGYAEITVEPPTTVEFLNAVDGRIALENVNGRYVFNESRVRGAGTALIDIVWYSDRRNVVADDLEVEIADGCNGITGLAGQEGESDKLEVRPNPARDRVQVLSPGRVIREVDVFDVGGRRIWTWGNGKPEAQVIWDLRARSGEKVSDGVYWMKVRLDPVGSERLLVVIKR